MPDTPTQPPTIPHQPTTRREAIAGLFALSAAFGLSTPSPAQATGPVKLVCFIRYQIDPFQLDAFRAYAEAWGPIVPRCGGHLLGYFVPAEGTNDVAWGLIAFESLAAYEAYRVRLHKDPDALANLTMVRTKRIVLREERNFVEIVNGTFEKPSTFAG